MKPTEHDDANVQPTPAWGDALMPAAAADRQAHMHRLDAHDVTPEATSGNVAEPHAASPADNPLLHVAGRPAAPDASPMPPYTESLPQTDAQHGNWSPLLGPGNEAMADGSSPAPRGYTGGAMGRVVSGLSPSFPEAASGAAPETSTHNVGHNGADADGAASGQQDGNTIPPR